MKPPKYSIQSLAACGLALFTLTQTASAITTSGVMAANETWSGNIELTGDVTVPSHVTLTILPGTHIAAWNNYDDTASGTDSSRIELVAGGGIINAVGTPSNQIYFTSSPLTPPAKRGDWYGVRLGVSTNGESVLNWCVVEYGVKGLTFEGGNPTVQNCTFRHCSQFGVGISSTVVLTSCLVSSNGVGVGAGYLTGGLAPVFMTNCVVANNFGGSVYYYNYIYNPGIAGGQITLINCTVTNHSGWGVIVYAQESDNVVAKINLQGCTISNNSGGVAAASNGYSGSGPGGDITATNCSIIGNTGNGLSFTRSASIQNCNISSNNGYGVTGGRYATIVNSTMNNNNGWGISSGDWGGGAASLMVSNCFVSFNANGIQYSGPTPFIYASTISYNSGTGVNIGMPVMTGCSVDHNNVGLSISAYSGTTFSGIVGNRIANNSTYELQTSGAGAVWVTNNYWGEPTTTELANNLRNLTKIYDSQDNASVGQVLLKPYLATDPFAIPPTIDPTTPADQVAAQGGTATFTVTATSGAPYSYQWRKGTGNLSGQTNSYLTLNPVQPTDAAANYNVIVANGNGSVTSRWATLTVLLPPIITSSPTNLTLLAGSTAAFHVTATGSPTLGYQWQKGSVSLANSGRISGAFSPDLLVSTIQAADADLYRCVVFNSVGTNTSGAATLTLLVLCSRIQWT